MGQPSREPGERVQVGSAFIQQRTVGKNYHDLDDMEFTEVIRKSLKGEPGFDGLIPCYQGKQLAIL